jgi:hypothetical protein
MSDNTKSAEPITNLTGRQMVLAAAELISASGLAHYVATHVSSLIEGADPRHGDALQRYRVRHGPVGGDGPRALRGCARRVIWARGG